MNPPANSAALLAREKRLIRPAGYLALLGVVLFVASVVIQAGVSGENLDTDAGRLAQYGEEGSTLVLARVVYALGWLCFILPLYVLFNAARARSDRVRTYIVAFCFIGPVLLAIQGPMQALGLKDAGETFLESEPAAQVAEATGGDQPATEDSGAADAAAEKAETKPGEAGAEDPDAAAAGSSESGGEQGGEVTTTPTEEPTEATDEGESDPGDATEQRAEDLVSDSALVSTAQYLLLAALLGLVMALVYIPMQAMRTGLMTRFWATLGMALGVALVLLPFAQLALVIWFLALGALLLGKWPGGRPPAWEAGVAIPWAPRGQEPTEPPDDAVEGSGRDVSGEQPAPSETPDAPGPTDAPGPSDAPDGAEGQNGDGGPGPRKRKRRR